jgi:hypothetical protein
VCVCESVLAYARVGLHACVYLHTVKPSLGHEHVLFCVRTGFCG